MRYLKTTKRPVQVRLGALIGQGAIIEHNGNEVVIVADTLPKLEAVIASLRISPFNPRHCAKVIVGKKL